MNPLVATTLLEAFSLLLTVLGNWRWNELMHFVNTIPVN
jgi:hypothetical protein